MKYLVWVITLLSAMQIFGLTVSEVQFEGNRIFSDQKLKEAIISYKGMDFKQQIILEDAKRLSDFYFSQGFLTAKVFTPQSIPLSDSLLIVKFQIDEGDESIVNRITFTSNTYLDSTFILQSTISSWKKLSEIPNFIEELIDLYISMGFYFAEAEINEISITNVGEINLNIKINEGLHCKFTKAMVTGNKITKDDTVIQLARLQNREDVTPDHINQAEQKLQARPYIKSCRIIPLDNQTLLYEIEEGSMTYLQALLGYDNDSGNEGRFLGYIDLQFDNLLGTDRSAGFYWENRQEKHSSVELRYHESGWDIPVAGDLYLFREEMDSTWVEVRYSADIYWYDLFIKSGLFFEKQDIYPGSRRPEIIEHTQFYKVGMIWESSKLNHYFNPTQGTELNLRYYYIWSKEQDSESGRQAIEVNGFRALPISGRWVQGININANLIEDKGLTAFDVFYLGGAGSVRGFLEKQFSGYRTGWINLETRYLLNTNTRVSVNADLGYYQDKHNGRDYIGSIGFGLRLPTPIGQFTIDIALPWQQEEFGGFMESILHFGIETRL